MRRVGGLIGPGSKVSEILGELFPVVDLEAVPGELLRLGGTFLAWGSASMVGAAGESSKTQLFNPVDSGTIITVSHFDVGLNGTDTVRYGIETTPLTNGIGTESHRDTRTAVTVRPVGEIRTESAVATAPASGRILLLSSRTFHQRDENSVAVLLPGSGLTVGMTTVALRIDTTFFWRERAVEASEINL